MRATNTTPEIAKPWQRRVAWALIASLANPATILPLSFYSSTASARDTDIYLNATYSGATAEPAIMLILDTSDSMNIPEPWREYDPDEYDSHVEYLWNSPAYINTISTGDPALGLTSAGSSNDKFVYNSNSNASANDRTMRYDSGWWTRKDYKGDVLIGTDLQSATLAYAAGDQTGDLGPRSSYRKYAWSNDGGSTSGWQSSHAYIYFVPLDGRPANDPAVEADARLRSNTLNKFLAASAVTTFGNTNPSTNPITRGGMLFGNQGSTSWGDPYINASAYNQCNASLAALTPSTVYAPSDQPRNAGKMLDQKWQRWEHFLGLNDMRIASFPGSDAVVSGYYQGYLDQYRDNNVVSGDRNGLPVRERIDAGNDNIVQAGDSYAGWSNLKPDMSGFPNLFYRLNEISDITILKNILNSQPGFNSAAGTFNQGIVELYKNFPPGEYYNTATNISIGAPAAYNLRKVRLCTRTGETSQRDARNTLKNVGGTCAAADADTDCNDATGSCRCEKQGVGYVSDPLCAGLADPGACGLSNNDTFYTRDNNNCGWSGRSSFVSKDYSGCAWSGRQATAVENVGTFYHGGTCAGTCTGPDCEAAVGGGTNYCSESTSGTTTISGNTFTKYRTDTITAGCSNRGDGPTYFHGGTCQGRYRTSPPLSSYTTNDTSSCNKTVTWATLVVGGVTYNDVRTDNGGCGDKNDISDSCTNVAGFSGQACSDCGNPTTSYTSVGGGGGTPYTVFNRTWGSLPYFDCKVDETTAPYMRNPVSNPSQFYSNWNSSSTPANNNHSYTTDAAQAVADASIPPVNLYSANYLNWKFGAKACRDASKNLITATGSLGSAATCRPIGRKTRLQIAKDALVTLANNTNGVRFGLMVFNKMSNAANGYASEGGNVAYAIRRMGSDATDSDYGNRATLIAKINSVKAAARTPLTETMYEAYRYFRGEAPVYGNLTTPAQGGGTISDGRDTTAVDAGGKYISPMLSNPNTTKPATCQKNYVVLVTDGGPEDDFSANSAIAALSQSPPYLITTVGAAQSTPTTQFEISPGVPYGPADLAQSTNFIWLDELTYFMSKGDISPGGASPSDLLLGVQSVKSYTIGFAGGNTPVLKNAAVISGGENYLAEDSDQLSTALQKAIDNIRDWNPTVAAPTVPINALNRSESSNYAYLAFFAPGLTQRWDGTVKKFAISTNPAVCGADLDSIPINYCLTGQTSFGGSVKNIDEYSVDKNLERTAKVRDAAVSLWSDPASPDGGKPTAGGTGHVLKTTVGLTPDNRKVFTHVAGSSTTLTAASSSFSEGNTLITKSLLGNAAMTDGERASILNLIRGGDPAHPNCSDADPATACTTWRTWPHGDVLHSQPNIITYKVMPDSDPLVDADGDGNPSNDQTPLERLFYLSNDGLLHAVDTATGEEQWAFVPEEVIPQLKAVKDNAVGEHIMAADGNPVLYVEDVDKNGEITTGDKAYLIFGLRRGGRALYAIDISDRTNPKFMWKIDNTVTGFSELGETWSTPDVAKMRVSTDPVLVFGAGYDAKANDMMTVAVNRTGGTAQVSTPLDHGYVTGDSVQITGAEQIAYNGTKTITVTGPKTFTYAVAGLPQTPATGSVRVSSNQGATMGRGVFFVNARTGALIRSFTNSSVPGMDYSIPSDTMALNSDIDSIGYADRMYVGDMGGFVWRFDIDDANASNWTVRKFADVTAGASPRRKIFFPPAVVKQEFLGQRFDAVYVGTGDRENPLRTDNEDMMFMIKDSEVGITATGSTVSFNTLDFYDITPNLAQSSDAGIASTAKDNLKAGKGWYFSLATGAVAGGEKVVNAPSVFFNVLRFGTYSPLASVSECVPPGKGAEYAMDANSGVNVVDTNKNGVINGGDSRSVSKYSLRGFPSGGSVVIRDGKVWLHNVSDGVTTGTQIGTAGQAQRAYWFQEPER